MKNVSIVIIGDELLDNTVLDKNSVFFRSFIKNLDYNLVGVYFVGDLLDDIEDLIKFLSVKNDLIITSGGLGPTDDDKTRYVLSKLVKEELEFDEENYKKIVDLLNKKGIKEVSKENKIQSSKPKSAKWIENSFGTADGIEIDYLYNNKSVKIASFPGVPREFKSMIENYFENREVINSILQIRFYGISESLLQQKWRELEISNKTSFLPSLEDGILVKIFNPTKEIEDIIRNNLDEYVVSYSGDTIEIEVAKRLFLNELTISTAESCTAGYIGVKLANISGISKLYKGSIIAYQNDIKIIELNVKKDIINNFGVVSSNCVEAMAKGVKDKYKSDISIATTGYIGPTGGDEFANNGDVYISVIIDSKIYTKKVELNPNNNRVYNRIKITNSALFFLLKLLDK